MNAPKRFETGLQMSETVGKQLDLLILHLNKKVVDAPKGSGTGLKPSETVGKQLYLLILHLNRK